MEIKWITIALMVTFSGGFAAVGIEKYSGSQCKIAYAASTKSAEDILKLCGH